jgi:hypothetical protein
MSQALNRDLLQACSAWADVIACQVVQHSARRRALKAYLAAVELELPASGVRRWLAWTRSELDAACLEIEDLRENAGIDEVISDAGAALRGLAPPSHGTPPTAPIADLNAQREARAARRAVELLVQAGGQIVEYAAFGTAETARKAVCAARKEIGRDGIRTVRGRGFWITQAGLRAACAQRLSSFGEYPDARGVSRLPDHGSRKAAA